jgi:predicted RNase H-like nuclease (RuvC/YqgF family)
METQTGMQTRQQTHAQLNYQISSLKTDNLDLQIRVEEQRREIVALKSQLRKAKSKSGMYKLVLGLTNTN